MASPKSKIKILFKMFYLYHKAAYDPLLELFEKDPQYDVSLSLTHEMVRRFYIFELDRTKKYIRQLQKEGHKISDEKEHFDVVIVPDVIEEEEKYGKTLLCFINHGTGFKSLQYQRHRERKKHRYMILVEGQFRVDTLNRMDAVGKSEVFKVGLPKMDPYFKGHYHREEMLKKLGLDPKKKTVLFSPTYKPTCVYDLKEAIFEATQDYNLIIKLHHYAWMGKFARHSQHYVIQQRLWKYPHAVLLPKEEYNILPYMFAVDTLVSEASSTAFDFLATGKIGVIYDLQKERFYEGDHSLLLMDNSEFLKDSFAHVDHPEGLYDGIKRALHPSEWMRAAADRDREYLFYQLDGKASQRTKELIERLYSEGTHFNNPT